MTAFVYVNMTICVDWVDFGVFDCAYNAMHAYVKITA